MSTSHWELKPLAGYELLMYELIVVDEEGRAEE
jgi:hypothetical protein